VPQERRYRNAPLWAPRTSHRARVGRPDLPGGYWIASADPIAAMHAVILTLPAASLEWIVLPTDGAAETAHRPVCAGMHLGQRIAARRQSHVDMRDAVFEVDLTLRLEAV
jgi:hypothetical protein